MHLCCKLSVGVYLQDAEICELCDMTGSYGFGHDDRCSCGFDVVQVKVKVKLALEQATMAQRGSRYIAVLFLQPRR